MDKNNSLDDRIAARYRTEMLTPWVYLVATVVLLFLFDAKYAIVVGLLVLNVQLHFLDARIYELLARRRFRSASR
jgi:hypothetical protein